MELREYYRKIREVEAELEDAFVSVVSKKTTDGGRGGVKTVVPRAVAAKLIVDGKVKRDVTD